MLRDIGVQTDTRQRLSVKQVGVVGVTSGRRVTISGLQLRGIEQLPVLTINMTKCARVCM